MSDKKEIEKDREVRASKDMPIFKLIPNILTTLALCAGLSAIRSAYVDNFHMAVLFVFYAAILDGLDGRAARLLNAKSQFGVEFDSLADLISFGVAPALILYMWVLKDIPNGVGWIISLMFAVCTALRLARFNVGTDDELSPPEIEENKSYFTGLASPSGAGMALLPLMLFFQIWPEMLDYKYAIFAIGGWVIIIALLMISEIPTFSLKGAHINRKYIAIALALVAFITALMLKQPWVGMPMIITIYMFTIPLASFTHWRKNSNKDG